jgi:hypothetical protein
MRIGLELAALGPSTTGEVDLYIHSGTHIEASPYPGIYVESINPPCVRDWE